MISTSIVLYKTNKQQLITLLNCIINDDKIDCIYLVDNSPTDDLKVFESYSSKIRYIFNNSNIGYGAAHNIALKKAIEQKSEYHIVLNPDIYFESDLISKLFEYMNNNLDVVYLLPKVIYPNGELQYLCKLLPTPSDLIFRRFIPEKGIFKKWKDRKDNQYCLKDFGYNKTINPPCLSGCFMFLRVSTLQMNNIFFDDNFFMYFEDFDLIRRLHRVGKTVFYPNETIVHNHEKASYKSKKMLLQHIKSAIKYFNKYGWIFDKERKQMNTRILNEIKEIKTISK